MRPAAMETSQLYHPFDEILVTSLNFFLDVFRKVFSKKKTSKNRYEETLAFLRFFPNIFCQKLIFFRRVKKI